MKKEFLNITDIQIDESGRINLNSGMLASIEKMLIEGNATAGGSNLAECDLNNQWGETYYFCFAGPGTNRDGCTNMANCGGSVNPLNCVNEMGCGGSGNPLSCQNSANCTDTTNRSCTNTFQSGCAGSTNTAGPTAPCP